MNCNQNEKISQVKVSTLVVGLDIGSTTHYARAFNWRGVELGKVFKFSNSREGFESFMDWMRRIGCAALFVKRTSFGVRDNSKVPASIANGRPFALLAERIFRYRREGDYLKTGCGEM